MPLKCSHGRGISLPEVLAGVALVGVVALLVSQSVVAQLRRTTDTSESSELRDQLLAGVNMLASDLRQIAPAGGDIVPGRMERSSIEFFSTYGSGVVCAASAADRVILMPNSWSTDSSRLTFVHKRVDPGDGALLLMELEGDSSVIATWHFAAISHVSSVVNPCAGSAFAHYTDAAAYGIQLVLTPMPPFQVGPGTPVRLVERVRYALYQSSDSKWYLGYCASASISVSCPTLQPVSGPYLPPASGVFLGGLELTYVDEFGVATSDPLSVRALTITMRGVGLSKSPSSGGPPAQSVVDSATIVVQFAGGT